MDTSYLTTQVAAITKNLHGLFDDIGLSSNERRSRETELFNALSEALHNQVRLVNAERDEMTEEANRIIGDIRQMKLSMGEKSKSSNDDDDLRVTYPLVQCLKTLKEKYNGICRLHRERSEQVLKLVTAIESYSSHLESSFVKINLPTIAADHSIPLSTDVSASYIEALDEEFSRIYHEYVRRLDAVQGIAEDIVNLWAELGTPQAQTDSTIVKYYRETPEQLGLLEDDVTKLKAKRDKLIDEKHVREQRIEDLKANVESLWDRLGVEEVDRKQFLATRRGCGLRVINDFEDELARLNELKRQNLHLFVEDARYRLQELWDSLYFSEDEMIEFTPAFTDVYSDALLSAHETEIERLEALREQRMPLLQLIERHKSLIKDRDDLASSSQDASRLMARGVKGERRDPTRLLREEKMRKRVAKELPKIETELTKVLESWEGDYGRPFLVLGERYLDQLAVSAAALPPRSKTPSTLGRSSSRAAAPTASALHRSTIGSIRGPTPSRSGAKTPTGTIGRNPLSSSISSSISTIGRSPTKLPARAPLSNIHGNNSPERPRRPASAQDLGLVSKTIHAPRAPPPRMRDLFVPPPAAPTPLSRYDPASSRSQSVASSHDEVRQVTPEDPYDDNSGRNSRMRIAAMRQSDRSAMPPPPSHYQDSYRPSSHYEHSSSSSQRSGSYDDRQSNGSRQISNTSTVSTVVSGSENWETYDDASEPEEDASTSYFAKMRAAAAVNKRVTPEGGYSPPPRPVSAIPGKKMRNIAQVMHSGNGVRASGSEAGWTDEDVF
ncbi:hypothetical protein L228DRAFT_279745 [Xylona heveae TC161]|uniref:Microtubule associated protein n=1 Tax=Xylona heveae (strain CBS 132557 / TC161) TaxID=1328760 RepID=A0A165JSB8_XYLHT|nr:hypothetical protein L228DRAFT_279745 [Xylona heveae TC161]KZF26566.1 hypothetical protein L228DRAFT_279745 [Xylona heveae TC161]